MKTKLIDIIELEEFTDDLIAKVQHQLPLESSYYFVAGINAILLQPKMVVSPLLTVFISWWNAEYMEK